MRVLSDAKNREKLKEFLRSVFTQLMSIYSLQYLQKGNSCQVIVNQAIEIDINQFEILEGVYQKN